MSRPPQVLEYNATIVEREDLSGTLARFVVRPDEAAERPMFAAGQYVVMGLNNEQHEELGGVRRPMSIASAPSRLDALEFYIRLVTRPVSENPFTPLLWTRKVGDRIYLRTHAAGHLTLADTVPEADPRMMLLVAAGTGLAPFLSIVRERAASSAGARLDGFAVMHGASYPEELGFRAELEGLVEDRGLRYLPTLSRARDEDGWRGARGRVEDFFLPERLEETQARLGLAAGALTPSRCVVLICGLHGTIATAIERLLPLGFEPDHAVTRRALGLPDDRPPTIFYEKYDTEPLLDVHDEQEVARLRALMPRASRGQPRG